MLISKKSVPICAIKMMTKEDILKEIQDSLGRKIKKFYKKSEGRIYIDIEPENIIETVTLIFKRLGARFSIATAVDGPDGIEILYHFSFDRDKAFISFRAFMKDAKNPAIDSITPIFAGAEWIEREIHELFGVDFKGHPNLKTLLLPDGWPEGKNPLRRNFKSES